MSPFALNCLSPLEIIEFQTHSGCNSRCTICSYRQGEYQISHGKMTNENLQVLFSQIAEEKLPLKRIIPYLNNEPFLDTRFIDILREIRRRLPYLEIEVSTNLSCLDSAKMTALLTEHLVDDFRISFFGADPSTYQAIMTGLTYQDNLKRLRTFKRLQARLNKAFQYQVCMVLLPGIDMVEQARQMIAFVPPERIRLFGYLDRAGNNPVKNNLAFSSQDTLAGCSYGRFDQRMCILWDGSVITCSQDWARQQVIGNVFVDGIRGVRESMPYRELAGKITGILPSDDTFICKKCKLSRVRKQNRTVILNHTGDAYCDAKDRKRPKTVQQLFAMSQHVKKKS